MKFSFGVRLLIIALVIAGLACAGLVLGFTMLNAGNRRVDNLAAAIAREAAEDDRLRAAQNALTQSAEDRAQLERHLIEAGGAVALIERLEALGNVAGLTVAVDEINVEPYEGGSALEVLALRFHGSGSWQQVSHLLSLIESLPLPLALSSVRFEASGGRSPVWRATFTVSVLASHGSP